jgi:serine/threonine protein kinase
MGMQNDPFIGRQLGAYQIQGKLGEGGMASVYKGYHLRLRREVAIKVILSEIMDHDGFQARFEREAQVIASLEHPNIVSVHDFGEINNLTYLVMQYVGGGTLRDQLRNKRPLEVARAINYTTQIAHALYHAHQRGIIHRDVKPPNILISATNMDHALLSDFGIAKLYWSNEDSTAAEMPTQSSNRDAALTSVDQIIGTADYMAPEQANGLPVDARTDVYALGVVLYHMLTGEVPFHSTTLRGLLFQHVYTAPPSVREKNPYVPEILAQIVAKAMAKAPEDRFQTAEAMASALASANTHMTHPQISLAQHDLPAPTFPPNSNPLTRPTAITPQWGQNAAFVQSQQQKSTTISDRTQLSNPGSMHSQTQLSNPGLMPGPNSRSINTTPGITDSLRPPVTGSTKRKRPPLSYGIAALFIVIFLILLGTRVVPGWLARPSNPTTTSSISTGTSQFFTENFQNNTRNWPTGSLNSGITAGIANNQYTIVAAQPATAFVSPQSEGTLPANFTLTTQIEQKQGAADVFYGLAFRFTSSSAGTLCYALIITSNGIYQIREYGHGYTNTSNPLWQGNYPYTSTSQSHTLQVNATGSSYSFSIDGKKIQTGIASSTLTNTDISHGNLALLVTGQQATLVATKVQVSKA